MQTPTIETPTPKRGPGRPRKLQTALPIPAMVPVAATAAPVVDDYDETVWYCWPAANDDQSEFDRLLAERRTLYESASFDEIKIYENDLSRRLVEDYRLYDSFTADNLLRYAEKYRSPFCHKGTLTASGVSKARILLTRERLMAGQVDDRQPDFSKLRDHLSPLALLLITGTVTGE